MHAQVCTHAWMAVHLHSMHMQILLMVLQIQTFSQCTCHTDLVIITPQWSAVTSMLKKHQRKCFLETSVEQLLFRLFSFPPTLFLYLVVLEPISAALCLRGCRRAEINGRVAGNLIMRHYEADMLSWLLCNITFASSGEAEGRHVRSFSARQNQSHTSSPC